MCRATPKNLLKHLTTWFLIFVASTLKVLRKYSSKIPVKKLYNQRRAIINDRILAEEAFNVNRTRRLIRERLTRSFRISATRSSRFFLSARSQRKGFSGSWQMEAEETWNARGGVVVLVDRNRHVCLALRIVI